MFVGSSLILQRIPYLSLYEMHRRLDTNYININIYIQ